MVLLDTRDMFMYIIYIYNHDRHGTNIHVDDFFKRIMSFCWRKEMGDS